MNKYIKLKNGFPILFSSSYAHSEIADTVSRKENVKSAGFWVLNDFFDCYGKSASLGIHSDQSDSTVLNKCFRKNVFLSRYSILDCGVILHGPNTLTLNLTLTIETAFGKDHILSNGLCYVSNNRDSNQKYFCCISENWQEKKVDTQFINKTFGRQL